MTTLSRKLIVAATSASFLLAACTTKNPYTGEEETSNTTRGAIIGALGGALVGALTNTSSGKQSARNALIGAGIGALAGGAVGYYMDEQEAKLRERLRNAGVSVTRNGDNIILNMENAILFELGSSELSREAREIIRSVSFVLNEYDQTIVEVSGFTDTTGSEELNQNLSEERAGAVAERLIRFEVMPQRLIVRGYGETRLKIRTGDGVNEPRNRRVEIEISPLTMN